MQQMISKTSSELVFIKFLLTLRFIKGFFYAPFSFLVLVILFLSPLHVLKLIVMVYYAVKCPDKELMFDK